YFAFGPRGSTVSGRQKNWKVSHDESSGLCSDTQFFPTVTSAPAEGNTLSAARDSLSLFATSSTSVAPQTLWLSCALTTTQSSAGPCGSREKLFCHSTHAHSAEADVARAKSQSPITSDAALFVIALSLLSVAPKRVRPPTRGPSRRARGWCPPEVPSSAPRALDHSAFQDRGYSDGFPPARH